MLTAPHDLGADAETLGERLAAANPNGVSVATAESLTGGHLAAAFSAAPEASSWYRGGVVAYQAGVKHSVLGTPPGPVVTADTATAMAISVGALLDAELAVGVTGVGGPGPEEDEPPGTVFLAVAWRGEAVTVRHCRFLGGPRDVMRQTTRLAVSLVIDALQAHSAE